MIIKENIKNKYTRVYSDNPDKKIHIINTNIDGVMLVFYKDKDYEVEEWDVNENGNIEIIDIDLEEDKNEGNNE